VGAPFPSGWDNFFVAEVGAAAALSGLLFVAVSINLTRILAIAHLPDRAGEALLILVGVLAISSFGLVPQQGMEAFGWESLGVGVGVWLACSRNQYRVRTDLEARKWLLSRVARTQLASLPLIVAGVLLIKGHASGMNWVVVGVLMSFAASILSAWVLLVEIMR
jgi:modulator of FtsH protease